MGVQKAGWHQGKGSRRLPILTSAGRHARVEWLKQAAHMVPKSVLRPPLAEIAYLSPGHKTVGEAIYAFDQEAAHHHLPYCVEEISGTRYYRHYGYRFRILVAKNMQGVAQQIQARLNPPPPPNPWMLKLLNSGHWTDLLATGQKGFAGWHVSLYTEGAALRSDGRTYRALLIRDEKRRRFGIREFMGDEIAEAAWPRSKWIKLAVTINKDEDFRNQLLSDDPDLPKMWRRH